MGEEDSQSTNACNQSEKYCRLHWRMYRVLRILYRHARWKYKDKQEYGVLEILSDHAFDRYDYHFRG